MTKEVDLAHHIHDLKLLLKTANDPKLLWEEMQILGKKAFNLQDKIEAELLELEKTTTEITSIQMLYETREMMWDIMKQLAERELELKSKPHPHTCCCHAHGDNHSNCCCHHHERETKPQKKCCCKKGKACKKK